MAALLKLKPTRLESIIAGGKRSAERSGSAVVTTTDEVDVVGVAAVTVVGVVVVVVEVVVAVDVVVVEVEVAVVVAPANVVKVMSPPLITETPPALAWK